MPQKRERANFILMRRGRADGRTLGFFIFDNMKKRYGRERKRIRSWGSIISQSLRMVRQGWRMGMITLTYDVKGTKVKATNWRSDDVRAFMKTLRGRMGKNLKAYAWVAELMANGNVHYHILIVYTGRVLYPDKAGFYGGKPYKRIWNWGLSHVDVKVRSPYYVLTYTGKEYQKDFSKFPAHARAFAVWIGDEAMKEELRYEGLSQFEKDLVGQYGWSELRRTVYVSETKKEKREREDAGLPREVLRPGNYEEWRRLRRDLLYNSDVGCWMYVGTYATEETALRMSEDIFNAEQTLTNPEP